MFRGPIRVQYDLNSGLLFAEVELPGVEEHSGLVAKALLQSDLVLGRLELDGVLTFNAILAPCPDDFNLEGETGSNVEFFEFQLKSVLVTSLFGEHAGGSCRHGLVRWDGMGWVIKRLR